MVEKLSEEIIDKDLIDKNPIHIRNNMYRDIIIHICNKFPELMVMEESVNNVTVHVHMHDHWFKFEANVDINM